jgi:thiamine-monophosphate kinase
MTEVDIVDWLQRIAPTKGRGIVVGIGDDCAIFRPRGSSQDLLFTTDQFIEGVHFRKADSPESVGHRALARGLSDIAAMGGEPRVCLLSLAKSRDTSDAWLKRFYRGLLRLAARTKTVLAGGDLAHGPTLACDIMVCGSVRRGRAFRRDGARAGDRIYVSGPLGGPASKGFPGRMFEPKLKFAQQLRPSACIDITDGLALDLYRICKDSGVSANLNTIPLAPGATERDALSGGDEYELLYTTSSTSPGIEIGRIEAGPAGQLSLRGLIIEPSGYDHFQ